MLVIKVEVHSAVTGKVTTVGTAVIRNVGGTTTKGDYKVAVGNKRDAGSPRLCVTRPQRSGEVTNYPRLSYNVWRLVIRALRSAFPEEK